MVSSTIIRCEKLQSRFAVGTSQHTLLKNRIKALYIAKALLINETTMKYTKEELVEALRSVSSIINKSEKGQQKFIAGTSHYNRFQKILNAMYIAESMLTDEIIRKN